MEGPNVLALQIQEESQAKHLWISRESIKHFEDVIDVITRGKCPQNLRTDCAVICAFLQNRALFEWFYKTLVDPELANAYKREKESYAREKMLARARLNLQGNPYFLKGGGLMRAFYSLMKPHGFTELQGVVFTGNAGGFVDTVANKILFKDLTGPMHGEFTHSLQWLSVCFLRYRTDLIEGGRQFSHSIADIYSSVIKIRIWPNTVSTMWLDEVRFTSKANAKQSPNVPNPPPPPVGDKTLWDFMVDCFSEKSVDKKTVLAFAEDHLTNLYTDSYRCPANITIEVQWGALVETFIGKWWKRRMGMYAWAVPGGKKWYHPNIYNQMVATKEENKGRVQTAKNTWRVTPQMENSYQQVNRTPSWANPDLEFFDPWDDDE